MRIDMKRDAETAKRKGFAGRTIFAVVALIVGFVLSYVVTTYLFNNEILTDSFFYNQLLRPGTPTAIAQDPDYYEAYTYTD